jgi:citrate lyase subunit beta/citryl-CoA lyase
MLRKGARRSQLYVPGNNIKMMNKANSLPADSFIFDLEDSVPLELKEDARNIIKEILENTDWKEKELCVRIDSLDTIESYHDLIAISEMERVDCIIVPKAGRGISKIYKATGKFLIPLIETGEGLMYVEDIVREEGVCAVSWASGDLAFSLGGDLKSYDRNDFVAMKVLTAARTYGIEPIDKVFFDVSDTDSFTLECKYAKGFGFSGKQVIHPSQVEAANRVFSPSEDEIMWARRVISALDESTKTGKGAVKVDGKLVDKVHVEIARRILNSV